VNPGFVFLANGLIMIFNHRAMLEITKHKVRQLVIR